MNLIIVQTIIIALIATVCGIVIGMALILNKLNKKSNPTLDAYNNFLSKQPKK